MKGILRRSLSVFIFVSLLFSFTQLSGCYVVRSGKMKRVIGTYELTSYTASEDMMAAKGINLFIAISSDGTGYFAYSDNETAPFYDTISARFIKDTENDQKYSYVEIDFSGEGEYEKFGVYSSLFTKTLNFSETYFKGSILDGSFGVDYTASVTLTRVKRATDLDYIKEVFGSDIQKRS